jgi:hypothetical protein
MLAIVVKPKNFIFFSIYVYIIRNFHKDKVLIKSKKNELMNPSDKENIKPIRNIGIVNNPLFKKSLKVFI